jgi:HK97 family phage portal protein
MGNAFVFKNIYRGQVAEMFVLNSVRAVQEDDMTARYFVRGKSGEEREVPAGLIWHLRGLSWDGFMGLDTLEIAKDALGLSMALEDSAASLHSNGVRPSGVYSVEGTLNETQQKNLVSWLKKEALTPGAPMVLDRAAKWVSTAMSSVDAQHKEMRDQQVEEVCRFFGVLPIMIGYTGDKANTYASAEAMMTAHKVHTLAPEYTLIQESADINLLTDEQRKQGYYFKFVVNALQWANLKDQGEYFGKALGSGGSRPWLTQDEVRALIEFDPMGGDAAQLLPPPGSNSTAPEPIS